jgi:hypothetical protein
VWRKHIGTLHLSWLKRRPQLGAIYGIWASEIPNSALDLEHRGGDSWSVAGAKMFCSGAGLIDRALVTVEDRPIDIDLRGINEYPMDSCKTHVRARVVRHLIEQSCTEIIRRLPRDFSPRESV